MGVDWVPARPRDGVAVGELRRLAAEHARLARLGGVVPAEGTLASARDGWREVDRLLRDALELAVDGGGRWPSVRVAVVAYSPVLPLPWRDGAWRTYLPEEAAAAVAAWRRWYERVRAGQVPDYLRWMALHRIAVELAGWHAALVRAASGTVGRTSAWAGKPRFLAARERVSALPVPPVVPAPGPPAESLDGLDRRQDDLYRYLETITAVARAFNSTVPAPVKAHARVDRPGADVATSDPELERFFDWVEPFLADGHGLYLWA